MRRAAARSTHSVRAFAFLSPALLVLAFVFGYQVVRLFLFSFSKWQGYRYTNTFHLGNFTALFAGGVVGAPLLRSAVIIAVVIPAVVFLAVFISHHLYRKMAGYRFYRWLFFLTSIIPVVVASIVWTFLLNKFGPVNTTLRFLGLDFLALDWFGNSKSAIFALCWIIIWREIGFSMLIFLAELDKVDIDAYEAALIDGASEFQMMRYISFPYLKGVAKMYTVTMTIYVLNNLFGVVLAATHGGPGFATTVMEYFIYFLSFRAGKVGLGTAVAVLLFLITMVLVFIYMRAFSRKKGEAVF